MDNIMSCKDPPGLYKPGLQAKLAMEKVLVIYHIVLWTAFRGYEMYNHKIITIFLSWDAEGIVHFYIRRKLDITRC